MAWALVGVVCAVMEIRLFHLINKFAVNILFGDEWGYVYSFFNNTPLWRLYFQQYGPHREGVGLIVQKILFDATEWNDRALAFAIGVVMSLAMAAALLLKLRIFGHISRWDVAIPFIFLTRSQYEIFVASLNLAPHSLPVLLVLLYCLAWMQTNLRWRYFWVLIVSFLLLYSGYGLFTAGLTPPLLLRELFKGGGDQQPRWHTALALIVSVLQWGAFFIGYAFGQTARCGVAHQPLQILQYMALMFASFINLRGTGVLPSLAGALLLGTAICIFAACSRKLVRERGDLTKERALVILLGQSLMLTTAAAPGRLCFGMQYAQSSRYILYVIPAFLALYFWAFDIKIPNLRQWVLTVFVIAVAIPAVWLRRDQKGTIRWLSSGKRDWRDCYFKTEDIKACDGVANFVLYPNPGAVQMKEKLEFLKAHRLNLYNGK